MSRFGVCFNEWTDDVWNNVRNDICHDNLIHMIFSSSLEKKLFILYFRFECEFDYNLCHSKKLLKFYAGNHHNVNDSSDATVHMEIGMMRSVPEANRLHVFRNGRRHHHHHHRSGHNHQYVGLIANLLHCHIIRVLVHQIAICVRPSSQALQD